MSEKLKILVVDDNEEFCLNISDILELQDYETATAQDGFKALEQVREGDFDLVLMDVRMPDMDGLTLLSRVKQIAPWVPVMIITGYGDIPMCVKALKMGAVDFVEKPFEREIFLHKVKAILKRDDFVDLPVGEPLTKTEKKVLKLILDGEGNKQIAHTLKRALRSVERHRSSIMHKFRVNNVVDLVKKTALINLNDID